MNGVRWLPNTGTDRMILPSSSSPDLYMVSPCSTHRASVSWALRGIAAAMLDGVNVAQRQDEIRMAGSKRPLTPMPHRVGRPTLGGYIPLRVLSYQQATFRKALSGALPHVAAPDASCGPWRAASPSGELVHGEAQGVRPAARRSDAEPPHQSVLCSQANSQRQSLCGHGRPSNECRPRARYGVPHLWHPGYPASTGM